MTGGFFFGSSITIAIAFSSCFVAGDHVRLGLLDLDVGRDANVFDSVALSDV